ncbi:MAG: hypothetical protein IT445_12155 [Phycisphaeraceae bacterium]|nr:hypothetical protein [Phycisphaeraceae bacterium]
MKKETPRRNSPRPRKPLLRFTPYAWAKLQWFCHRGETEIGGFGVSAVDDLLLLEDFVTVKQDVTCVSVKFDDEAVADFFDQQVDLGRKPQQFARIWLHTHPGNCPNPSGTDEETFARVFGSCDWAVMFIVAEEGATYARLRFNVGPGGECVVPVGIDCARGFPASDHEAWESEYQTNIHPDFMGFGCHDSVPSRSDLPAVDGSAWRDDGATSATTSGGGASGGDPFDVDPPHWWDEPELMAMVDDPDFYDAFEDESEVLP